MTYNIQNLVTFFWVQIQQELTWNFIFLKSISKNSNMTNYTCLPTKIIFKPCQRHLLLRNYRVQISNNHYSKPHWNKLWSLIFRENDIDKLSNTCNTLKFNTDNFAKNKKKLILVKNIILWRNLGFILLDMMESVSCLQPAD